MGKISLFLVDKYRNFRRSRGKTAVSAERLHQCRLLYPMEEPEAVTRRQDSRLVSQMGILILTGSFFGVLLCYTGQGNESVSALARPEYGEPEVIYELEVQRGNGERIPVEICLKETDISGEEAGIRLQQGYEELLTAMPGENTGLEHVETALTLPDTAQFGTVSAEWTSRNRELLTDYGEILKKPEEISDEGESGSYLLTLTCGGYSQEYEVPVTVYPAEQEPEAAFTEKLRRAVEDQEAGKVTLPESLEGETIQWYTANEQENRSWIFLLPLGLALFLAARYRNGRKEQLKVREKELLLDYPELVSKFTVLLQAGISVRNVWERMVREYEEGRAGGERPRYVYEEMCFTWNQLENGMYESRAYGEFGRRCGLHVYMKFGTLLEQNLRQGTTELAVRMKEEADSAFEERKNLAKRLGEEAETKLMLPMFMMLFVVLAVVMVPAFLSF